MKVSDEKLDKLLMNIFYAGDKDGTKREDFLRIVRDWLSEVEAEQNRRIADELLDMGIPSFLKEQNQ